MLAFADSGDWPYAEELTAGFVYLRLHGSPHTYASRYSHAAIARWADRIEIWRSGGEPADARRLTDRPPPRRARRDVYVYFDNDHHAHAPANALELSERLGIAGDGSARERERGSRGKRRRVRRKAGRS